MLTNMRKTQQLKQAKMVRPCSRKRSQRKQGKGLERKRFSLPIFVVVHEYEENRGSFLNFLDSAKAEMTKNSFAPELSTMSSLNLTFRILSVKIGRKKILHSIKIE